MLAPTASFIRVRFDASIDRFLSSLSDYLANSSAEGNDIIIIIIIIYKSLYIGTFFSQHDPRAGLGCRPYHIKVLSAVDESGQSCEQVFRVLKDVGIQFSSFQGKILPLCVVSNLGTVSLKVRCNDCINISKYLSSRLIGSQDISSSSSSSSSSPNDDCVLVTIGSYHGPQLNNFEVWLNSQLSLNSSVFPVFKGEIVEMSEEFNNYPHYPVKLVGSSSSSSSSIASSIASSTTSSSIVLSTTKSNFFNGTIESSTLDVEKSGDTDDKLLSILQQLCIPVIGIGIIHKKSYQGAGLSKVVPSEISKFKESGLQIYKEVENALKLVGADRFLKMLDLIANPFPTTLNQELGRIISDSGGIELIPITNIHIPVIRGTNAGSGSIELSTCTVDQSIYCYPNHKNTRTPIICYPSEMLLTSWNTLVGRNSSNIDNTSSTIRGAIIALNFQSTPFKTMGLSPENGFYFSIPIGWIGGKIATTTTFKDVVKEGGRVLQPIDKSVHSGSQQNKQYSQQQHSNSNSSASASPPSAKQSDDGENDRKSNKGLHGKSWTCPNCNLQVFSRRTVCFKCHACRPDQTHPVPRRPPVTSKNPDGDVRDGDWICHHCNGHNFASKLACFTCHKIRPGFEDALAANAAGGNGDDGESTPTRVMPGDWTCPKCNENVFAKRSRCYKCSNPRP